jgi:hypothetical protein
MAMPGHISRTIMRVHVHTAGEKMVLLAFLITINGFVFRSLFGTVKIQSLRSGSLVSLGTKVTMAKTAKSYTITWILLLLTPT